MSLAIGERAYGDGEQYGGQYGEQYGEHEHMESNLESNLERACGAGICDMESKAAYSAWFPWYHGPYRPIVADARSPHPPRRSGVGWRGRVGERCVDFSFLPCRLVSVNEKV